MWPKAFRRTRRFARGTIGKASTQIWELLGRLLRTATLTGLSRSALLTKAVKGYAAFAVDAMQRQWRFEVERESAQAMQVAKGGTWSVAVLQGGVDLVAQSAPVVAREQFALQFLAIQAATMSSFGSAVNSLANKGVGEPFGAAQQSAAVDPLDVGRAGRVEPRVTRRRTASSMSLAFATRWNRSTITTAQGVERGRRPSTCLWRRG